jgi:hypothetical protein
MPVLPEGRQVVLEMDLELGPLAPPLDQGGVGGDPVQPGAERRAALERADLAKEAHEDVLHDLFRIPLAPGDPESQPVEAGRMALHQRLQRRHVPAAETLDQVDLRSRCRLDHPAPHGSLARRTQAGCRYRRPADIHEKRPVSRRRG